MFLGIYAVILTLGILGLKRIKRRDIEKHGCPKDLYIICKGLFIFIMFFAGFSAGFMQLLTYKYYRIFTEKRKAKVVQVTGMCDSEDVRYVMYREAFGGIDSGTVTTLELKCRIPPTEVLETCCAGAVRTYTEDGMVYEVSPPDEAGHNHYLNPDYPTPDDWERFCCGEVSAYTRNKDCMGYFTYVYNSKRWRVTCYETGKEWYRIRIQW